MSYGASYYSSSVDGGLVAMIFGMIGIIFVVCLVAAVIMVASMWKIFTKAGEEGWKSIIPFLQQLHPLQDCLGHEILFYFAGTDTGYVALYDRVVFFSHIYNAVPGLPYRGSGDWHHV